MHREKLWSNSTCSPIAAVPAQPSQSHPWKRGGQNKGSSSKTGANRANDFLTCLPMPRTHIPGHVFARNVFHLPREGPLLLCTQLPIALSENTGSGSESGLLGRLVLAPAEAVASSVGRSVGVWLLGPDLERSNCVDSFSGEPPCTMRVGTGIDSSKGY